MVPEADPGIYGPGSVSWRVNREQAMLLGGGCALLLQLAHPLVAAGVSDHSDFAADPLKRLRRTLEMTLAIVFGASGDAERAARGIRATHARVSGSLKETAGRFPAGTRYDAQDPALLLWVQATLFQTSIDTYRRLFGRLERADLLRYHAESKVVARMLGVPDEIVPPDYDAFQAYWRLMLASDEIAVSETARRLARAVMRPRIRNIPGPIFRPLELFTVGLMPPEIRERFGFGWGGLRNGAFRAEVDAVRTLIRVLPPRLRVFPAAREAERRMSIRGPARGCRGGG